MALFGSSRAVVGVDIGTASIKVAELIDRSQRTELVAYAEANLPNILIDESQSDKVAIQKTVAVLAKMMDQAGISSDAVVAALPSAVAFSSVVELPNMPDSELEQAVRFAARDIVPVDLDEMVLGYSRVATKSHMDSDQDNPPTEEGTQEESKPEAETKKPTGVARIMNGNKSAKAASPIFITAAPKKLVDRYTAVIDQLHLRLLALELETFPLARSLMDNPHGSALIVDIGDQATTYHLIDRGTPRISTSIEYGGHHITRHIAYQMSLSLEEAEEIKQNQGLAAKNEEHKAVVASTLTKQMKTAQQLLQQYQSGSQGVSRSILIGGGAKLPGLADYWAKKMQHSTIIGNPWRGLSYPKELDSRLQELGPSFGVAIGLAQREFKGQA